MEYICRIKTHWFWILSFLKPQQFVFWVSPCVFLDQEVTLTLIKDSSAKLSANGSQLLSKLHT